MWYLEAVAEKKQPAPARKPRARKPAAAPAEAEIMADLLAGEPEPEAVEREPIVIHSNAPWVGSGYGAQSALFGPLLQSELHHEVTFSAFFGLRGAIQPWLDPKSNTLFKVYPAGRDGHGNDVLSAHYRHITQGRKGFVLFLSDVWVLKPQIAQTVPMMAWCPVDHDPVIPDTVDWFKASGALPVAISRFGQEQLQAAGIKQVQYVPHGYDPDVFKPADRNEVRRALHLPEDTFTVGMVSANLGQPSRKGFWQGLKAYSIFHKRHPDTALYLHTIMENPIGEDLPAMCDALDIRPYCADPYALTIGAPPTLVSAVLNACDVLLQPSHGEGFGVPLLEAQACGTPVITTNFSANPEVAPAAVGNWNVGGQLHWTAFKSCQMTPDIEEIVESLEQAYAETAEERQNRRVSVYAHAQQYRAEGIVHEFWKPTIEAARAEMAWRAKRMKRITP